MAVEWTVLLSAACGLGGFALSYLGLRRLIQRDVRDAGRGDGVMLAELGYVKSGVDDIRREQREQARTILLMMERLAALEQSAKQAHKRIDQLEDRHD